MGDLMALLDERWQTLFQRLAAGEDAPPTLRLRTEGLMEAALVLELATEEALTARMAEHYQAAFGRSLEQHFDADWQLFFTFPQIPAMAHRAPVYPTTPDDL